MGSFAANMNNPQQAVILCGGKGTRLLPYTESIPKPMIICNKKPFLWYLLSQLNEKGIDRFLLLTGYLGEQIRNYFEDGSSWGWEINYSEGPVEWDTGKRIWEAREEIDNQFLLLYSDNFTPFPLDKIIALHEKNQKPITFMVVSKNPGNINLDGMGNVKTYNNNRCEKELEFVEIGYMVIEKEKTLSYFDDTKSSFSKVLQKMAEQRQISAMIQNDQYYSISDPDRWVKAERYLSQKKIILIDRDGVINKKAPRGEYILNWNDFEWIIDTRLSMKALSREGFKFIVITNQAGISRGNLKQINLDDIHQKMVEEFRKDGVDIIDIYVCPHGWDDGCFCRKPNPGMLLQASKEHLFRLDKTLFIGDDPRDCQTAKRAGCNSIFIGEDVKLEKLQKDEHPIYSSPSMLGTIDIISQYFSPLRGYNIL